MATRINPGDARLLLAPTSAPAAIPTELSSTELFREGRLNLGHLYLEGCEGSGLETGLQRMSLASAALGVGAEVILANAWPIVDAARARRADLAWSTALGAPEGAAIAVPTVARRLLREWDADHEDALPPHCWAGLHFHGRAR